MHFCSVGALWSIHGTFFLSYYTDVFAVAIVGDGVCGKVKSACDVLGQLGLDWEVLVLNTDCFTGPVSTLLFVLIGDLTC